MLEFVTGANATCAAVAGLFFFRFWRQTGDRLFARFALAFWLLGAHWLFLAATDPDYELRPLLYGIRLLAFLVIIGAIVEKNRVKRRA
jgi:Family of unknown function (DUF5985)